MYELSIAVCGMDEGAWGPILCVHTAAVYGVYRIAYNITPAIKLRPQANIGYSRKNKEERSKKVLSPSLRDWLVLVFNIKLLLDFLFDFWCVWRLWAKYWLWHCKEKASSHSHRVPSCSPKSSTDNSARDTCVTWPTPAGDKELNKDVEGKVTVGQQSSKGVLLPNIGPRLLCWGQLDTDDLEVGVR